MGGCAGGAQNAQSSRHMPLDRGIDLSLAPLKGDSEENDRQPERRKRKRKQQDVFEYVGSQIAQVARDAQRPQDRIYPAVEKQAEGNEADVDGAKERFAEAARGFRKRERRPERDRA